MIKHTVNFQMKKMIWESQNFLTFWFFNFHILKIAFIIWFYLFSQLFFLTCLFHASFTVWDDVFFQIMFVIIISASILIIVIYYLFVTRESDENACNWADIFTCSCKKSKWKTSENTNKKNTQNKCKQRKHKVNINKENIKWM